MTSEEKLAKLKELVKLVDESITRREFDEAVTKLVAYVKKVESTLTKTVENTLSEKTSEADAAIKDALRKLEQTIRETQAANDSTLAALKKRSIESMNGLFNRLRLSERFEEVIERYEDKVYELNQKIGKVPEIDVNELAGLAAKLVPPPVIPDHTQEMQRLEREIKSLKDSLKAVQNAPKARLGMRKVPIIKRVNLTAQVDGNTRSFTLPKDTVEVIGVFGTQFPVNFDSSDWTFVGNTLTLADAIGTPQAGQTLFAIVETLFYG